MAGRFLRSITSLLISRLIRAIFVDTTELVLSWESLGSVLLQRLSVCGCQICPFLRLHSAYVGSVHFRASWDSIFYKGGYMQLTIDSVYGVLVPTFPHKPCSEYCDINTTSKYPTISRIAEYRRKCLKILQHFKGILNRIPILGHVFKFASAILSTICMQAFLFLITGISRGKDFLRNFITFIIFQKLNIVIKNVHLQLEGSLGDIWGCNCCCVQNTDDRFECKDNPRDKFGQSLSWRSRHITNKRFINRGELSDVSNINHVTKPFCCGVCLGSATIYMSCPIVKDGRIEDRRKTHDISDFADSLHVKEASNIQAEDGRARGIRQLSVPSCVGKVEPALKAVGARESNSELIGLKCRRRLCRSASDHMIGIERADLTKTLSGSRLGDAGDRGNFGGPESFVVDYPSTELSTERRHSFSLPVSLYEVEEKESASMLREFGSIIWVPPQPQLTDSAGIREVSTGAVLHGVNGNATKVSGGDILTESKLDQCERNPDFDSGSLHMFDDARGTSITSTRVEYRGHSYSENPKHLSGKTETVFNISAFGFYLRCDEWKLLSRTDLSPLSQQYKKHFSNISSPTDKPKTNSADPQAMLVEDSLLAAESGTASTNFRSKKADNTKESRSESVTRCDELDEKKGFILPPISFTVKVLWQARGFCKVNVLNEDSLSMSFARNCLKKVLVNKQWICPRRMLGHPGSALNESHMSMLHAANDGSLVFGTGTCSKRLMFSCMNGSFYKAENDGLITCQSHFNNSAEISTDSKGLESQNSCSKCSNEIFSEPKNNQLLNSRSFTQLAVDNSDFPYASLVNVEVERIPIFVRQQQLVLILQLVTRVRSLYTNGTAPESIFSAASPDADRSLCSTAFSADMHGTFSHSRPWYLPPPVCSSPVSHFEDYVLSYRNGRGSPECGYGISPRTCSQGTFQSCDDYGPYVEASDKMRSSGVVTKRLPNTFEVTRRLYHISLGTLEVSLQGDDGEGADKRPGNHCNFDYECGLDGLVSEVPRGSRRCGSHTLSAVSNHRVLGYFMMKSLAVRLRCTARHPKSLTYLDEIKISRGLFKRETLENGACIGLQDFELSCMSMEATEHLSGISICCGSRNTHKESESLRSARGCFEGDKDMSYVKTDEGTTTKFNRRDSPISCVRKAVESNSGDTIPDAVPLEGGKFEESEFNIGHNTGMSQSKKSRPEIYLVIFSMRSDGGSPMFRSAAADTCFGAVKSNLCRNSIYATCPRMFRITCAISRTSVKISVPQFVESASSLKSMIRIFNGEIRQMTQRKMVEENTSNTPIDAVFPLMKDDSQKAEIDKALYDVDFSLENSDVLLVKPSRSLELRGTRGNLFLQPNTVRKSFRRVTARTEDNARMLKHTVNRHKFPLMLAQPNSFSSDEKNSINVEKGEHSINRLHLDQLANDDAEESCAVRFCIAVVRTGFRTSCNCSEKRTFELQKVLDEFNMPNGIPIVSFPELSCCQRAHRNGQELASIGFDWSSKFGDRNSVSCKPIVQPVVAEQRVRSDQPESGANFRGFPKSFSNHSLVAVEKSELSSVFFGSLSRQGNQNIASFRLRGMDSSPMNRCDSTRRGVLQGSPSLELFSEYIAPSPAFSRPGQYNRADSEYSPISTFPPSYADPSSPYRRKRKPNESFKPKSGPTLKRSQHSPSSDSIIYQAVQTPAPDFHANIAYRAEDFLSLEGNSLAGENENNNQNRVTIQHTAPMKEKCFCSLGDGYFSVRGMIISIGLPAAQVKASRNRACHSKKLSIIDEMVSDPGNSPSSLPINIFQDENYSFVEWAPLLLPTYFRTDVSVRRNLDKSNLIDECSLNAFDNTFYKDFQGGHNKQKGFSSSCNVIKALGCDYNKRHNAFADTYIGPTTIIVSPKRIAGLIGILHSVNATNYHTPNHVDALSQNEWTDAVEFISDRCCYIRENKRKNGPNVENVKCCDGINSESKLFNGDLEEVFYDACEYHYSFYAILYADETRECFRSPRTTTGSVNGNLVYTGPHNRIDLASDKLYVPREDKEYICYDTFTKSVGSVIFRMRNEQFCVLVKGAVDNPLGEVSELSTAIAAGGQRRYKCNPKCGLGISVDESEVCVAFIRPVPNELNGVSSVENKLAVNSHTDVGFVSSSLPSVSQRYDETTASSVVVNDSEVYDGVMIGVLEFQVKSITAREYSDVECNSCYLSYSVQGAEVQRKLSVCTGFSNDTISCLNADSGFHEIGTLCSCSLVGRRWTLRSCNSKFHEILKVSSPIENIPSSACLPWWFNAEVRSSLNSRDQKIHLVENCFSPFIWGSESENEGITSTLARCNASSSKHEIFGNKAVRAKASVYAVTSSDYVFRYNEAMLNSTTCESNGEQIEEPSGPSGATGSTRTNQLPITTKQQIQFHIGAVDLCVSDRSVIRLRNLFLCLKDATINLPKFSKALINTSATPNSNTDLFGIPTSVGGNFCAPGTNIMPGSGVILGTDKSDKSHMAKSDIDDRQYLELNTHGLPLLPPSACCTDERCVGLGENIGFSHIRSFSHEKPMQTSFLCFDMLVHRCCVTLLNQPLSRKNRLIKTGTVATGGKRCRSFRSLLGDRRDFPPSATESLGQSSEDADTNSVFRKRAPDSAQRFSWLEFGSTLKPALFEFSSCDKCAGCSGVAVKDTGVCCWRREKLVTLVGKRIALQISAEKRLEQRPEVSSALMGRADDTSTMRPRDAVYGDENQAQYQRSPEYTARQIRYKGPCTPYQQYRDSMSNLLFGMGFRRGIEYRNEIEVPSWWRISYWQFGIEELIADEFVSSKDVEQLSLLTTDCRQSSLPDQQRLHYCSRISCKSYLGLCINEACFEQQGFEQQGIELLSVMAPRHPHRFAITLELRAPDLQSGKYALSPDWRYENASESHGNQPKHGRNFGADLPGQRLSGECGDERQSDFRPEKSVLGSPGSPTELAKLYSRLGDDIHNIGYPPVVPLILEASDIRARLTPALILQLASWYVRTCLSHELDGEVRRGAQSGDMATVHTRELVSPRNQADTELRGKAVVVTDAKILCTGNVKHVPHLLSNMPRLYVREVKLSSINVAFASRNSFVLGFEARLLHIETQKLLYDDQKHRTAISANTTKATEINVHCFIVYINSLEGCQIIFPNNSTSVFQADKVRIKVPKQSNKGRQPHSCERQTAADGERSCPGPIFVEILSVGSEIAQYDITSSENRHECGTKRCTAGSCVWNDSRYTFRGRRFSSRLGFRSGSGRLMAKEGREVPINDPSVMCNEAGLPSVDDTQSCGMFLNLSPMKIKAVVSWGVDILIQVFEVIREGSRSMEIVEGPVSSAPSSRHSFTEAVFKRGRQTLKMTLKKLPYTTALVPFELRCEYPAVYFCVPSSVESESLCASSVFLCADSMASSLHVRSSGQLSRVQIGCRAPRVLMSGTAPRTIQQSKHNVESKLYSEKPGVSCSLNTGYFYQIICGGSSGALSTEVIPTILPCGFRVVSAFWRQNKFSQRPTKTDKTGLFSEHFRSAGSHWKETDGVFNNVVWKPPAPQDSVLLSNNGFHHRMRSDGSVTTADQCDESNEFSGVDKGSLKDITGDVVPAVSLIDVGEKNYVSEAEECLHFQILVKLDDRSSVSSQHQSSANNHPKTIELLTVIPEVYFLVPSVCREHAISLNEGIQLSIESIFEQVKLLDSSATTASSGNDLYKRVNLIDSSPQEDSFSARSSPLEIQQCVESARSDENPEADELPPVGCQSGSGTWLAFDNSQCQRLTGVQDDDKDGEPLRVVAHFKITRLTFWLFGFVKGSALPCHVRSPPVKRLVQNISGNNDFGINNITSDGSKSDVYYSELRSGTAAFTCQADVRLSCDDLSSATVRSRCSGSENATHGMWWNSRNEIEPSNGNISLNSFSDGKIGLEGQVKAFEASLWKWLPAVRADIELRKCLFLAGDMRFLGISRSLDVWIEHDGWGEQGLNPPTWGKLTIHGTQNFGNETHRQGGGESRLSTPQKHYYFSFPSFSQLKLSTIPHMLPDQAYTTYRTFNLPSSSPDEPQSIFLDGTPSSEICVLRMDRLVDEYGQRRFNVSPTVRSNCIRAAVCCFYDESIRPLLEAPVDLSFSIVTRHRGSRHQQPTQIDQIDVKGDLCVTAVLLRLSTPDIRLLMDLALALRELEFRSLRCNPSSSTQLQIKQICSGLFDYDKRQNYFETASHELRETECLFVNMAQSEPKGTVVWRFFAEGDCLQVSLVTYPFLLPITKVAISDISAQVFRSSDSHRKSSVSITSKQVLFDCARLSESDEELRGVTWIPQLVPFVGPFQLGIFVKPFLYPAAIDIRVPSDLQIRLSPALIPAFEFIKSESKRLANACQGYSDELFAFTIRPYLSGEKLQILQKAFLSSEHKTVTNRFILSQVSPWVPSFRGSAMSGIQSARSKRLKTLLTTDTNAKMQPKSVVNGLLSLCLQTPKSLMTCYDLRQVPRLMSPDFREDCCWLRNTSANSIAYRAVGSGGGIKRGIWQCGILESQSEALLQSFKYLYSLQLAVIDTPEPITRVVFLPALRHRAPTYTVGSDRNPNFPGKSGLQLTVFDTSEKGIRVLMLGCPLRVKSELVLPVEVIFLAETDAAADWRCILLPGECHAVPLTVAASCVSVIVKLQSEQGPVWTGSCNLRTPLRQTILSACASSRRTFVCGLRKQRVESGAVLLVTLFEPVQLVNQLPRPVTFLVSQETPMRLVEEQVHPGESRGLTVFDWHMGFEVQIRLSNGKWSERIEFSVPPSFSSAGLPASSKRTGHKTKGSGRDWKADTSGRYSKDTSSWGVDARNEYVMPEREWEVYPEQVSSNSYQSEQYSNCLDSYDPRQCRDQFKGNGNVTSDVSGVRRLINSDEAGGPCSGYNAVRLVSGNTELPELGEIDSFRRNQLPAGDFRRTAEDGDFSEENEQRSCLWQKMEVLKLDMLRGGEVEVIITASFDGDTMSLSCSAKYCILNLTATSIAYFPVFGQENLHERQLTLLRLSTVSGQPFTDTGKTNESFASSRVFSTAEMTWKSSSSAFTSTDDFSNIPSELLENCVLFSREHNAFILKALDGGIYTSEYQLINRRRNFLDTLTDVNDAQLIKLSAGLEVLQTYTRLGKEYGEAYLICIKPKQVLVNHCDFPIDVKQSDANESTQILLNKGACCQVSWPLPNKPNHFVFRRRFSFEGFSSSFIMAERKSLALLAAFDHNLRGLSHLGTCSSVPGKEFIPKGSSNTLTGNSEYLADDWKHLGYCPQWSIPIDPSKRLHAQISVLSLPPPNGAVRYPNKGQEAGRTGLASDMPIHADILLIQTVVVQSVRYIVLLSPFQSQRCCTRTKVNPCCLRIQPLYSLIGKEFGQEQHEMEPPFMVLRNDLLLPIFVQESGMSTWREFSPLSKRVFALQNPWDEYILRLATPRNFSLMIEGRFEYEVAIFVAEMNACCLLTNATAIEEPKVLFEIDLRKPGIHKFSFLVAIHVKCPDTSNQFTAGDDGLARDMVNNSRKASFSSATGVETSEERCISSQRICALQSGENSSGGSQSNEQSIRAVGNNFANYARGLDRRSLGALAMPTVLSNSLKRFGNVRLFRYDCSVVLLREGPTLWLNFFGVPIDCLAFPKLNWPINPPVCTDKVQQVQEHDNTLEISNGPHCVGSLIGYDGLAPVKTCAEIYSREAHWGLSFHFHRIILSVHHARSIQCNRIEGNPSQARYRREPHGDFGASPLKVLISSVVITSTVLDDHEVGERIMPLSPIPGNLKRKSNSQTPKFKPVATTNARSIEDIGGGGSNVMRFVGLSFLAHVRRFHFTIRSLDVFLNDGKPASRDMHILFPCPDDESTQASASRTGYTAKEARTRIINSSGPQRNHRNAATQHNSLTNSVASVQLVIDVPVFSQSSSWSNSKKQWNGDQKACNLNRLVACSRCLLLHKNGFNGECNTLLEWQKENNRVVHLRHVLLLVSSFSARLDFDLLSAVLPPLLEAFKAVSKNWKDVCHVFSLDPLAISSDQGNETKALLGNHCALKLPNMKELSERRMLFIDLLWIKDTVIRLSVLRFFRVLSFDGAIFTFMALNAREKFSDLNTLFQLLSMHYYKQLQQQWYHMVLSFDLVGRPLSRIRKCWNFLFSAIFRFAPIDANSLEPLDTLGGPWASSSIQKVLALAYYTAVYHLNRLRNQPLPQPPPLFVEPPALPHLNDTEGTLELLQAPNSTAENAKCFDEANSDRKWSKSNMQTISRFELLKDGELPSNEWPNICPIRDETTRFKLEGEALKDFLPKGNISSETPSSDNGRFVTAYRDHEVKDNGDIKYERHGSVSTVLANGNPSVPHPVSECSCADLRNLHEHVSRRMTFSDTDAFEKIHLTNKQNNRFEDTSMTHVIQDLYVRDQFGSAAPSQKIQDDKLYGRNNSCSSIDKNNGRH